MMIRRASAISLVHTCTGDTASSGSVLITRRYYKCKSERECSVVEGRRGVVGVGVYTS